MKYKAVTGIILIEICDEYFLISHEKTISINFTAAQCWKEFINGTDKTSLINMLSAVYDTDDVETLSTDVNSLIDSFYLNHLITRYRQ